MDPDLRLRRHGRETLATGAALLALMLASLGSAYLRLGAFNVVAGLAIAAIKAALVLWLFMRLRDAPALIRFVAAIGFAVWAVLVVLTGLDYETRVQPPAPVQRPLQLVPLPAASEPAAASGVRGSFSPASP
jgi:cytochrome c oxidase subunit 4